MRTQSIVTFSAAILVLTSPGINLEASGRKPGAPVTAKFKAGDREIAVSRVAGGGDQPKEVFLTYLHRPLLALEAGPGRDWPKAIHRVEEGADETKLLFRLWLTTRAARDRARETVLADQTELAFLETRLRLDPTRVQVAAWPVKMAKVQVYDLLEQGKEVAGGQGMWIDTRPNWIDVSISVPASREQIIKELFDRPEDVILKVNLLWFGVEEKTASVEVDVQESLRTELEAAVTSSREAGSAPLFRWDRERLAAEIRKVIRIRRIAAEGLDTHLTEGMVNRVLEAPVWVDYESLDEDTKAALAEHMKPLVDTLETVTTDDLKKTKATDNRGEVTVSVPIEGVEVGTEGELKENWERVHGISLKETKTKNEYVPHQVELTRIREDWRTALASAVEWATVQVRGPAEFEEEANLTLDYTLDAIEDLVDHKEGGEALPAVPLGAMLCYFGDGELPPEGYEWADGQGVWPLNAGWLRPELRGEPLPDMRNTLVGGAPSAERVGERFENGRLVLPEPTAKRTQTVAPKKTLPRGLINRSPEEVPGRLIFTLESGNPVTGLLGVGPRSSGNPWTAYLYPLSIDFESFSFPEEERTILLDSSLSNPPHVQCRWIVRTH